MSTKVKAEVAHFFWAKLGSHNGSDFSDTCQTCGHPHDTCRIIGWSLIWQPSPRVGGWKPGWANFGELTWDANDGNPPPTLRETAEDQRMLCPFMSWHVCETCWNIPVGRTAQCTNEYFGKPSHEGNEVLTFFPVTWQKNKIANGSRNKALSPFGWERAYF